MNINLNIQKRTDNYGNARFPKPGVAGSNPAEAAINLNKIRENIVLFL